MITVALPTWRNREILWLPLEGLCRQVTTVPWELIVYECASDNEAGEHYVCQYIDRLKNAGCVKIIYMYSRERLLLSRKWKDMAAKASGKLFCLQGSDDYPHPTRNQDAWDANADWHDCKKYYSFDINSKVLIEWDGRQKKTTPRSAWRSGFNMTIRTSLFKNLPDRDVGRGVDGYLMANLGIKTKYLDTRTHSGVGTSGANTISYNRLRFYQNITPPFYPTDRTIHTIGLPNVIAEKLQSMVIKNCNYALGLPQPENDKKTIVLASCMMNACQVEQQRRIYHDHYQSHTYSVIRDSKNNTNKPITTL